MMDISVWNTLLDVVMIVAIVGLWVAWFKQSGQRKKVESMLEQASEELQQATLLLDKVMTQLPALQQQEEDRAHTQAMVKESDIQDKVSIQRRVQPRAQHKATPTKRSPPMVQGKTDAVPRRVQGRSKQQVVQPKREQTTSATASAKAAIETSGDAGVQPAQIMRLNREGLSKKAIAEQLNIPIAQVRLMLLLQAPKV